MFETGSEVHIIFVQPVHKVVIILHVSATAVCLHPHSPLQAEQHSVNSLCASYSIFNQQEEVRKTVII